MPQPTPAERLQRMRTSFDKDRSILAEDYAFFTGPEAPTPDAPKSPSRARRRSAAPSGRKSPGRS